MLAAMSAEPAAAQRLRGRLMDLQTNEPISSGVLTLLTEDRSRVTTTVSDDSGSWTLNAPGPGTYLVEAKRLGYQPWIDGPIEIRATDDWQSVYHLNPLAVSLDPVEIRGELTQRYLNFVGFFERQKSDFGHFITRDDIERRRGNRITDLLATVPGVRMVPTGDQFGRLSLQLRGGSLARGGLCSPRIFVDGLIFSRGDSRQIGADDWGNPEPLFEESPEESVEDWDLGIDAIAHPSSIAAIEIYRSGAQIPVKFGGTSIQTQCGVILIWTRVGQIRQQKEGGR
jgi:hypothetical protein